SCRYSKGGVVWCRKATTVRQIARILAVSDMPGVITASRHASKLVTSVTLSETTLTCVTTTPGAPGDAGDGRADTTASTARRTRIAGTARRARRDFIPDAGDQTPVLRARIRARSATGRARCRDDSPRGRRGSACGLSSGREDGLGLSGS